MLQEIKRPLTIKEQRLLKGVISHHQRRLKRLPIRILLSAIIVCGVLWALTMLASKASWLVISAFWLALAILLGLWIYLEQRSEIRNRLCVYEEALAKNEAQEIRIQAEAMVEFEEEEDEGACYAFQIEENKIVFVCGQGFYKSAKFPNTDFSIIHIYNTKGQPVELLIDKHGEKLKPSRVISAEIKRSLMIPDHLQIIDGKLQDLETLLRSEGNIWLNPYQSQRYR